MDKTLAVFGVIFVLVLGVVLASYAQSTQYYGTAYKKALASQLPDKCATPPGYSEQEWREHMGHHPDQYRECL